MNKQFLILTLVTVVSGVSTFAQAATFPDVGQSITCSLLPTKMGGGGKITITNVDGNTYKTSNLQTLTKVSTGSNKLDLIDTNKPKGFLTALTSQWSSLEFVIDQSGNGSYTEKYHGIETGNGSNSNQVQGCEAPVAAQVQSLAQAPAAAANSPEAPTPQE